MNKKSDSRDYNRIESVNFVSMETYDPDGFENQVQVGRTLNLSPGGIKLEVKNAPPLFTRVSIQIALGNNILRLNGDVVSHVQGTGDFDSVGIKFSNMGAADKVLLEEFLRNKK